MNKLTDSLLSFFSQIGWFWTGYMIFMLFLVLQDFFAVDSDWILGGTAFVWFVMFKIVEVDRDKWKKAAHHFAEEAGKYQRIAKLITHLAEQKEQDGK